MPIFLSKLAELVAAEAATSGLYASAAEFNAAWVVAVAISFEMGTTLGV